MSNDREKQMMAEAEEYVDEVKATFTGSEEGKHQERLVAINDFCAGWRAADSHPNWIPVERELPKKDGRYLFYDEELGPEVSSYYKGVTLMPTITHWAPKPQPPQGKEE